MYACHKPLLTLPFNAKSATFHSYSIPPSSDCSLSLNGMTCLWCSFLQMTPSSGMFNMFAEFDSCRWLDDVSSDGCFYLGLHVCVFMCHFLSKPELVWPYQRPWAFSAGILWCPLFLFSTTSSHLFFISSNSPSTGIYFCFGRTTIINFCKLWVNPPIE